MTIAVRLDGAGKVFNPGTEGEVVALDHIDLAVDEGEFVSLIGPSGCGKSTMLRLVGDLLSPTSGVVEVNGKTPQAARLARDYGMVFQAATLLEWRTVSENIQLPLEVIDHPKGDRDRVSSELLDLVLG